jgi:hypothetical protein
VIGTLTQVADLLGVRTYARTEWTFSVTGAYTRPFYYYETTSIAGFADGTTGVTVNLELTQDDAVMASPEASVTKGIQPCYYARDATVETVNVDQDKVLLLDTGKWHARVAFMTEGVWYRRIVATDSGGTSASAWTLVSVRNGGSRGFIRVGDDSRYFAYEDGTQYLAQGVAFEAEMNRSWPIRNEQDDWPTMSENGLQTIRFSPSDHFGMWGVPNHCWRSITSGSRVDFLAVSATMTPFQLVGGASPGHRPPASPLPAPA